MNFSPFVRVDHCLIMDIRKRFVVLPMLPFVRDTFDKVLEIFTVIWLIDGEVAVSLIFLFFASCSQQRLFILLKIKLIRGSVAPN
jgi:hypothetical protein